MREKICPIAGPGKLSASERERMAREIIVAASGADTEGKVVKQSALGAVTFREQAAVWLDKMRNRKRKPVAPSTLQGWACGLEKWVNPILGDFPLDSMNNLAMRDLVAKMVKSGLSPKYIENNTQIVKMVVASAVTEQGEEIFPRKWNHEFIDAPEVKNQRQPSFTGEVVTGILANTEKERDLVLFALCAGSGLRFGEALGIDVKNVSQDCRTIRIVEKAWYSSVQNFLKTDAGKREVDLHPSVAALLQEYIGKRESGLLFQSRNGKPLQQSNVLRRVLHPILAKLGQAKCGMHAFRRFRNTYLRNKTSTPPGVLQFWLGHTGGGMSDLYDKVRNDVTFRKEVAEKAGLGFKFRSKKVVVGPNGPKWTETPNVQMAANA